MYILYCFTAVIFFFFHAAQEDHFIEAILLTCASMGGFCILQPNETCPSGILLDVPCHFRRRCCSKTDA